MAATSSMSMPPSALAISTGTPMRAVEDHAEVELPGGFGIGLDNQRLNLLPVRAGLLGHERILEHGLGDCLAFSLLVQNLTPPSLSV